MFKKVTDPLAVAIDHAAKIEKKHHYNVHTVNTLFIGILRASHSLGASKEAKKEIDELNKMMSTWGVEAEDVKYQLQSILPKNIDESKETALMDKVVKAVTESPADTLSVLNAILANKTPEIASILPNAGGVAPDTGKKKTKPVKEQDRDDEDEINIISFGDPNPEVEALVVRLNNARENLMEKVFGQDHAINTFIDGLWNSELVAMADENRKTPRGVFLFAGAPGVGKTFFAEEAAKEMDINFLRLDMSAYSYHEAVTDLTGYSETYKNARKGLLTDFVAKNPRSFVLFDEIEKASSDVINLLLQILDAGKLVELYDNTEVSFKDVTVVFTTNAGRQLYEGNAFQDNADASMKKVIDALKSDINPATNAPYFPLPIISRISAGYPIMFNQLEVQDLEKVCRKEFEKVANQMGEVFHLGVTADDSLFFSLLFSTGGRIDARSLTAKTGQFVRDEMKKVVNLFDPSGISTALQKFNSVHFSVDMEKAADQVKELYHHPDKVKVMFVGMPDGIPKKVRNSLTNFEIFMAEDMEEAEDILAKKDIELIMLQIDSEIPELEEEDAEGAVTHTIDVFDYVPVSSADLSARRKELVSLRKKYPEIPVYILESNYFAIDKELKRALMQDGARGIVKLFESYRQTSAFAKRLNEISTEIYVESKAKYLKKLSKVVSFETAPRFDKEKGQINIRLRNFQMEQYIEVKDQDAVVTETENINIKFEDVIGAASAKEELNFFIDYLKDPKGFISKGFKAPKGVLLYGMPGTGKTMLAKALAGEAGVAFLSTEGSSLVNKYLGNSAEAVRNLFAKARKYAPSIVFIDEIDVIGRQRSSEDGNRAYEEALTALLTEMDGMRVDPKRPVFVLAATNYDAKENAGGIGSIDAALARRFDRAICVELPDKQAREEYLTRQLDRTDYEGGKRKVKDIADRSIGMSLATLEQVIERAKRVALNKKTTLTEEILDTAFEEIVHGDKKDWGKDVMERVARHEAGHAVLSYLANKPVSYITIVARGNHGGYVQQKEEYSPIMTKQDLLNEIRILLGGRAAEIVYYGSKNGLSSGVSSDLRKATRIAKNIICHYGMDEDFSLAVIDDESANNPFYAELIHNKVNELLKAEMDKAIEAIEDHKEALDALVKELLEKNQLNAMEVEDIMLDF